MTKLDTIATIAIGDIAANGRRLTPASWLECQRDVDTALRNYGTVVAATTGIAVTSDQPTEETEQTAVWIVVDPAIGSIRYLVSQLLDHYGLSSACFSVDRSHEPIFPTDDGYRPAPAANVAPCHAYYPSHKGYSR